MVEVYSWVVAVGKMSVSKTEHERVVWEQMDAPFCYAE